MVLRLTLTAEGRVTGAEVTESGGADFDAAAVEAAREFVFEPAEVDGRPAPIRIAYRYAFVLRREAPTTARFEGVVRERRRRTPSRGDGGPRRRAPRGHRRRGALRVRARAPGGARGVALARGDDRAARDRALRRGAGGDGALRRPPPRRRPRRATTWSSW
ncbi:MAG: TonB family protein [Polyangiales bacterium]